MKIKKHVTITAVARVLGVLLLAASMAVSCQKNTAQSASLTPSYAVISCGQENDYGHPTAQTPERLDAQGTEIFRTDGQGTVVALCDGTDIVWSTVSGTSRGTGGDGGSFPAGDRGLWGCGLCAEHPVREIPPAFL